MHHRSTLAALLFATIAGSAACGNGAAKAPTHTVVVVGSQPPSAAPTGPIAPDAPPSPTARAADPSALMSVAPGEPAEAEDVGAPPTPPSAAPQGNTCGLHAKLKAVTTAAGDTSFALTLTNRSKRSLSLVVPGDGSGVGWRTPVISWTVATPSGTPVAELPGGRCGMMNRIEPKEIFTLAPGASRTVSEWLGSPRVAAGTYDVRVRYRNDPALLSRKGNAAPDVVAKLASSSACDITTAAVRVKL